MAGIQASRGPIRGPTAESQAYEPVHELCRYFSCPPLATQRLSRLGGGRLLYRLKHCGRDCTTYVVFQPKELVERLAILIPPPRFHGARYHATVSSA